MSEESNFEAFDFNFEEAEKELSLPTDLVLEFNGEVIKIESSKEELQAAGIKLVEARELYNAQKEKMKLQEDSVKTMSNQIDKIKKEAQEQVDVLSKMRATIESSLWDDRKEMRRLADELYRAERMLRQALENDMVKQKYIDNSMKFDELTKDFYWRQFAYKHQIEGAKLLATAERGICGDKMGLGKSLTSLIYLDMLESQRCLIIVPDDTVSNFVHEIAKWSPHREFITLGKKSKSERELLVSVTTFLTAYTVVINYSAWRKDKGVIKALSEMRFDTVILDEAHSIKETTTAAYKGCRQIILAENSCPECRGPVEDKVLPYEPEDYRLNRHFKSCKSATCSWSQNLDASNEVQREAYSMCSVRNLLPMTGTVILNKPTDLFALLTLVDPVNFREKYQFERDYCMIGYDNKITFKPGGLDALVKKLSGRYIARDRHSTGVVLPKQEVVNYNLVLDPDLYPDQYRVVTQLTQRAAIMLNNGKKMSIMATIALITRKRQANVWPAGIILRNEDGDIVFSVGDDVRESIKIDRCIDPNGGGLIPEVTAEGDMEHGERVVVFSQFKGPLIELERRLKEANISVVRFDGDTPQYIRDQAKQDFDRSICEVDGYTPKWQVILCNYKTGGMGLNFTAATQMIILDLEWNPGKNDQALARIDRMGQTEETTVHVLHIDRSIDTWMQALMDNKRDMVEGFEETATISDLLRDALGGDEML